MHDESWDTDGTFYVIELFMERSNSVKVNVIIWHAFVQ